MKWNRRDEVEVHFSITSLMGSYVSYARATYGYAYVMNAAACL